MNESVIKLRKSGKSIREIAIDLGSYYGKIYNICVENGLGNIGLTKRGKKISESTKLKISNSRKEFYKNNPDKHNWKSKEKFKSVPCNKFKEVLDEMNILYVEEFTPLTDRHFSIDIAFPNKKVGIEINGNQHYEKNGNLKAYYQNRHDIIEKSNWKLYEIHFSVCFNKDIIKTIIENINKENLNIFDFDYDEYLFNKLNKKNTYCVCGMKILKHSKMCLKCFNKQDKSQTRKVKRPNYDVILDDVKRLGYCGTGRKYGVSDNSIRKWIKYYESLVGIKPTSEV